MTVEKSKFDPMAWVNKENADNSQSRAEDRTNIPTAESYRDDELGKAQAVCDELMARGANIAESYDDYLRLGFSLAEGLGSDGHDIYHALCSQSGKYLRDECERKWQECYRRRTAASPLPPFIRWPRMLELI